MGASESTEHNTETEASGDLQKRFMGKIQFPYSDLSRAEELCRALLEIAGRAETEQTQLAVKLDMSANGGTFRGRLSAAKMFGLIETPAARVKLAPLGRQILEAETRPAARTAAFMSVELYAAMYDRYNGYALPPAAAIERQMEELGVPPKQKERARQAFVSSAETAGFFASNGRFSKPALAAPTPEEVVVQTKDGGGSGGSGGNGNTGGDAERKAPQRTQQNWDQDVRSQMSNSALEYRLVDLITEAHQKDPKVVSHIIAVITFLKTKDVTDPSKQSGES